MSSSRKGIDGALTAYWLLENPGDTEAYINGEKPFKNIKARIKSEQKKDATAYPHAKGLIGLHELFSQFGSHADFSSFSHRMKVVRDEKGNVKVLFDYFHKPGDEDEYRYYFLCILHAYLQMFNIFREYFDREFKIVDPAWEGRIQELSRILPSRIRAFRDRH